MAGSKSSLGQARWRADYCQGYESSQKGWPTFGGIESLSTRNQRWDRKNCALQWQALRRAGKPLSLGKTTTPEFGWKRRLTDSPLTGMNPKIPGTRNGTPGGFERAVSAASAGSKHRPTQQSETDAGRVGFAFPELFCGLVGAGRASRGRIPVYPPSPARDDGRMFGPDLPNRARCEACLLSVISRPDPPRTGMPCHRTPSFLKLAKVSSFRKKTPTRGHIVSLLVTGRCSPEDCASISSEQLQDFAAIGVELEQVCESPFRGPQTPFLSVLFFESGGVAACGAPY